MKKLLLTLMIFSFSLSYCEAQCPDENSFWHRIVYLRDSSGTPLQEQLSELLPYVSYINKCSYRNDSTHALLLLRIGWLYGATQKDFVKAIHYTLNSINIIHQHIQSPNVNPTHLIKSYFNLQILYDSLKENKLKMNSIDSCITLAVKYNTGYPYAVQLIYWRTQELLESGDYYKAIDYANIGEVITKKSGYQVQDVFNYLSWKINALISLSKYNEAEELLNKSIHENHLENNKKYQGNIYALLARLAEQRGNFTKTVEYSDKSIRYDKMIGNYNGCAATLNNQGYYLHFLQLKQYDAALRYYNQALLFADNVNAMNILDNIANVYVEKEKFDSAFYFFQLAFNKIEPGTNEAALLKNSELLNNVSITEYLVGLILDKGDAFRKRYFASGNIKFISEALQVYSILNLLMEKLKDAQYDINSKLYWQMAYRKMYERAIEACVILGKNQYAFYFFEKSRAVLLIDQLSQLSKISNDDILQQAQGKRKILLMERNLTSMGTSDKNYTQLQTELFTAKQELDRIKQSIKTNNPLLYQSFLDTNFVSLKDIQKTILVDHNALVEIFDGDSAVYSLIITTEKTNLNKINKKEYDSTTKLY
ncbi:MAG TPA: tetratricopeptide repeat protein, partial [Puia sp.]|nr:tetratricopeptide repeat protein [Puia sp.]